MSDLDVTASLADRGSEIRLRGQVIPPVGTTVGFVLTATAAGSSWQASAGGGGLTNLDGGAAASVYLAPQSVDGGSA